MNRSWAARRYLLIRGPTHIQTRLIQATYTALKRRKHPDLAPFIDHPPTTQAPLLFYPGCYIHSPQTIRNTLKILDHLAIPYQTLGGLTYCCGLPHRLQGQTKKADACTTRLTTAINTVNPQTIVTSCLECLEALQHIKTQTNASYEILHTLELIHHHQAKFPHTHTDTPLLLHEPCRLTPRLRTTIIDLAASLGNPPILLPPTTPSCCKRWTHDLRTIATHHHAYLTTAAAHHATIICPCLTCLEVFKKTHPTTPLTDLIDLYAASLPAKEATP